MLVQKQDTLSSEVGPPGTSKGKRAIYSTLRSGLVSAISVLILFLSMGIALLLRFDGVVPAALRFELMRTWLPISLLSGAGFIVVQLHRVSLRYSGMDDLLRCLAYYLCFYGAMFITLLLLNHAGWIHRYPISCFFMSFVISTMGIGGMLVSGRLLNRVQNKVSGRHRPSKRVLIIGAGAAGSFLVGLYHDGKAKDKRAVVVVDDDPDKQSMRLRGIPVESGIENVSHIAAKYQADEIVIAIPSATRAENARIIQYCTQTSLPVYLLPPERLLAGEQLDAKSIRRVNINDLLSRDEVHLHDADLCEHLRGRTILVTGGGGSIGSELCRQIARFSPRRIIIMDIYENNAYSLLNELSAQYGSALNLIIRIGSIRDYGRLKEIFEEFHPEVVFHAAAHKHVPILEENRAEAIKNNVNGTLNVARVADEYGVERFVLLSTDKAVNPTNVMGATKRVAELIIQSFALRSTTKYMAVRFGNVLGSNGSVIPLFQKQIENGGPITLTDKNITRYFMTIPEASQLVLRAAGIGKSGCIYVLEMGEPVRIYDLAINLIHLSGFVPEKDIQIEYTGLRPGEKLFEELIMQEEKEVLEYTQYKKIRVIDAINIDVEKLMRVIDELNKVCGFAPGQIDELLREVVPTYMPKNLNDVVAC